MDEVIEKVICFFIYIVIRNEVIIILVVIWCYFLGIDVISLVVLFRGRLFWNGSIFTGGI